MKTLSLISLLLFFLIGCKVNSYNKVFTESVYTINKNDSKTDTFNTVKFYNYKDVLIQTIYQINSKTRVGGSQPMFEQKMEAWKFLLVEPKKRKCLEFDLQGSFLKEDTTTSVRNLFIAKSEKEENADQLSIALNSIKKIDNLKDTLIKGVQYKYCIPFFTYADTTTGNTFTTCFYIKDKDLKTRFNILGHYPNVFGNYNLVGIYLNPEKYPESLMTWIYDMKPMSAAEELLASKMYNQAKKSIPN